MISHSFIFEAGHWEGEGEISFSMAEDILPFKMEWNIAPLEDGAIKMHQKIQIESFPEPMNNYFLVSEKREASFSIILENHLIGKVSGKGVVGEKVIAWEFHKGKQEFEGYEIYELQDNGEYRMRAEFMAGEDLRTFVRGTIKKSPLR